MFASREEVPKFQYSGRSAACADRSWQRRKAAANTVLGGVRLACLRKITVIKKYEYVCRRVRIASHLATISKKVPQQATASAIANGAVIIVMFS